MKDSQSIEQPAGLQQAVTLTDNAAQVGFDWPTTDGVFDKIHEEIEELQAELASVSIDPQRTLDELGDILFAVANLARKLALDPEAAIHHANRKFERRFGFIAAELKRQGKDASTSSLADMDALWNQAKVAEKR